MGKQTQYAAINRAAYALVSPPIGKSEKYLQAKLSIAELYRVVNNYIFHNYPASKEIST
jgi:hypothetical protein